MPPSQQPGDEGSSVYEITYVRDEDPGFRISFNCDCRDFMAKGPDDKLAIVLEESLATCNHFSQTDNDHSTYSNPHHTSAMTAYLKHRATKPLMTIRTFGFLATAGLIAGLAFGYFIDAAPWSFG